MSFLILSFSNIDFYDVRFSFFNDFSQFPRLFLLGVGTFYLVEKKGSVEYSESKAVKSGVKGMFSGTYYHTLDPKGRIIIPAKFREDLGESFMLTRGLDGCLFVFTMAAWNDFVAKLDVIPMSEDGGRAFTRYFFANAAESRLDKQGRLNIPQTLLDHAHIGKDVVSIGVNTRIEIWAKEVWDDYISTPAFSEENIAENMKKLGI